MLKREKQIMLSSHHFHGLYSYQTYTVSVNQSAHYKSLSYGKFDVRMGFLFKSLGFLMGTFCSPDCS